MKSFSNLKSKPYIIAELSSNHAKKKDIVFKSIEAAAQSGADAIKTQLFTPSSLTIPDRSKSPIIKDENSPWNGSLLYDLYEEAALPYDWYPDLINCAKNNSIDIFASVFDIDSMDFAVKLNFPLIKISSFELIHEPLLQYVSSKGIPTIVSTGMADISEIDNCVKIFSNNNELCLLKCTSDYPSSLDATHVGQMKSLSERYKLPVGLSDHSISNLPSIVATSIGAIVIEKHFILDKDIKTPDSFFSLDKEEFTSLVKDIRSTEKILNRRKLDSIRLDEESHSYWERPSIYYSKDLKKGEIIKAEDLIVRRPSLGLHPNQFKNLIGKVMNLSVTKYQATKNNHFS